MHKIGIPDKMFSLIEMCVERFESKVKIENEYQRALEHIQELDKGMDFH